MSATQPVTQIRPARPHVYPVRLSDAEREGLARRAAEEDLTIAQVIRRTLRAAMQVPAQTGR